MEEKKNQYILSTEFSDFKFDGISLKEICSKLTEISDIIALNLRDEETADKLDIITADIQKYVQALTEGIDAFTFKRKGNNNVG